MSMMRHGRSPIARRFSLGAREGWSSWGRLLPAIARREARRFRSALCPEAGPRRLCKKQRADDVHESDAIEAPRVEPLLFLLRNLDVARCQQEDLIRDARDRTAHPIRDPA